MAKFRVVHAAVLAGLPIAAACGFIGQQRETHWATHADASAAGAIAPGRLPDWVPRGARDLKERRNAGSGALWVRFDMSPEDRPSVASACEPVAALLVARPASARGVAWWPSMLQQDFAKAADQFDFRRCTTSRGDGWVAVHRSMPWVFYWEVGR